MFQRGGARVIGIPVGEDGIEVAALERALEKERPRLMVLTPNFQNPTGTTIPEVERGQILEMARRAGVIVVENDLYGALRYTGRKFRRSRELDGSGETILLGSFSKIAFPGLRVGWAIGPRPFIARLTEAKEASDLHSDQLSQAVLLRFAESGRLAAHHRKMLAIGVGAVEGLHGRLRARIAAGQHVYPAGRRDECVGAAAGASGCVGAGGAGGGGRCQFSAGPLFCRVAAADARACA